MVPGVFWVKNMSHLLATGPVAIRQQVGEGWVQISPSSVVREKGYVQAGQSQAWLVPSVGHLNTFEDHGGHQHDLYHWLQHLSKLM